MNNKKLSHAFTLICTLACACDDASADSFGFGGEESSAQTEPESEASGDDESCDPEPGVPEMVEVDRHAIAFARTESVFQETIQLADGELHLAQLLDHQGALIASFSMEVHDGAVGSVLTTAEFAYDDQRLEYRVERVASADGTWSEEVDFIAEPTDSRRRMELLSATVFESENVLGPEGEQADIGGCVGAGLVTGGTCVACGLCTTGTAGVCFLACAGACGGGVILTACACGEYDWC